jgi:uncharacterized membrane protein YpjA
MTLDTTINLPTLVTLGLAIVALIAWLVRLEGRVTATAKDVADFEHKLGAIQALIVLHKEQFHEYQLQVAREYTTHNVVAEIKRDIITEIGRMEQRMETQVNRLVDSRA